MKKVKIYLNASCLLLFLTTCDKEKLTPATREGKNTFSCKINGKVWVPDGSASPFGMIQAIDGGFFNNSIGDTTRIWIFAHKSNDEEIHIYLNSTAAGRHDLNKTTLPQGASFRLANYGLFRSSSQAEFITSTTHTGFVTISKADTSSVILAGTFEFSTADPRGNLVNITDGRFDINSKNL